MCTEERSCEDTVGRCHLQAQERDLTRNHPCQHLELGFPTSRLMNLIDGHEIHISSLNPLLPFTNIPFYSSI